LEIELFIGKWNLHKLFMVFFVNVHYIDVIGPRLQSNSLK